VAADKSVGMVITPVHKAQNFGTQAPSKGH